MGTPSILTKLGEARCRLGQSGEGLNCLAEAAQIIEATDERRDEAELHRVRGDVVNATGDQATIEQSYHQALGGKVQSFSSCEPRPALPRRVGVVSDSNDLATSAHLIERSSLGIAD